MKTKRALLLILIVAALACGCLLGCGDNTGYDPGRVPTYRPSTDEPENYGYRYTVIEGEVRIDGYMSRPGVVEKKHEIPSEIYGYTVTAIGDEAFRSNRTIEEIIIPDTVVTIGQKAFMYSYITSVVIPSSVREIGADAFHSCIELQKVYFSDGLTSIGKDAFLNCVMLTEADLSQNRGLTELDGTFTDCFKLSALKLPSSVVSLKNGALENTGLESFHITARMSMDRDVLSRCKKLSEITVDKDNKDYAVSDGVLFDKDLEILLVYPAQKQDTSYVVPSGVGALAYCAIYRADNLISLDLNEVQSIGMQGLARNSNLGTICGGENVNYINKDALIGTKWFEENDSEFVALGEVLLRYNGNGKEVDLTGYATIMPRAFYGNESLEKVRFGSSLRSIYEYAFAKCTNLKEVYLSHTSLRAYVGTGAFDDNASGRKIYVPEIMEETYRGDAVWKPYRDFIESYDPDAV